MSLLELVIDGDQSSVEAALQGGADVNGADSAGTTALHRAASRGDLGIVNALLDAGANAMMVDQAQQTALDWAVFDGHSDVMERLIEAGSDVASRDQIGASAIHWASAEGNVEIVRAILTLAHSLDIGVIAEGIETREQLQRLKLLDCEYGQGFLFSRPMEHSAQMASSYSMAV